MKLLFRLLREEEAATAVEYAVMLALILMSIMGAITTVGGESGSMWGGIETKIRAAGM